MICYANVIVYGFGNPGYFNIRICSQGASQLSAGIHCAVSAVKEHITDSIFSQNGLHRPVILLFQRISGRADGCSGGRKKLLAFVSGKLQKIQKTLLQNPFTASDSPIYCADPIAFFGLCKHTIQGGVEHRRRAASVNYQYIIFHKPTCLPAIFTACFSCTYHTYIPSERAAT